MAPSAGGSMPSSLDQCNLRVCFHTVLLFLHYIVAICFIIYHIFISTILEGAAAVICSGTTVKQSVPEPLQ